MKARESERKVGKTNRVRALEDLAEGLLDRVVDLFDDVLVAVGEHEKHASQHFRVDQKPQFWCCDDQVNPSQQEQSCHLVGDLFVFVCPPLLSVFFFLFFFP